jgi:hypothetical protein
MKWILYKGQVHTHVSIYNFTYKLSALKVHGNLHKNSWGTNAKPHKV